MLVIEVVTLAVLFVLCLILFRFFLEIADTTITCKKCLAKMFQYIISMECDKCESGDAISCFKLNSLFNLLDCYRILTDDDCIEVNLNDRLNALKISS